MDNKTQNLREKEALYNLAAENNEHANYGTTRFRKPISR